MIAKLFKQVIANCSSLKTISSLPKFLWTRAREKGFKAIVATRGVTALEFARSYKPDAITLDVHIPDMDGWTILNILKSDSNLRHIPVDIITNENDPLRGLSRGALRHFTKPVSRAQIGEALDFFNNFLDQPEKHLLIVTVDEQESKQISDLLADEGISIIKLQSGKEALAMMSEKAFDCIVTGVQLSDMSAFRIYYCHARR